MPHMANLPWIYFYFLIAIFLTLFWIKENFYYTTSKIKQNLKITTKTNINWKW